MTLRNATPHRFSPMGLSDTLDITDVFPGAMASLQNLIPDPTTTNIWTCRPASIEDTTFGSFTTPGAISVLKVVGGIVYGLIASGRFAGKDEPFSYNLATNTFNPVANVTGTNTPTTQATTGDWVPPTMDGVGAFIVVTHPGFSGGNYFGAFDITNPSSPRWHADNLLATGAIMTLATLVAGTAYTAGTYLNVPLTGGSGAGATADIVVAGGGVTSVTLDTSGSAYVIGDTLSAAAANIGGTGTGFSIKVATIQNAGLIQFSTPPAWVRQFNERAYFGINPTAGLPSVVFTDPLVLGASNANQALTFGDTTPLIAATPLPLSTTLGGIIQSLIVFKSLNGVVQITGDAATTDLAVNVLPGGSGTLSPRSIVSLPTGIAYLDHDGFRSIDFNATISDPIGASGTGVTVPFLKPVAPSRVNAASNGSVLRVSVQNSVAIGQPWQEYWYDLVRKVWSGPHTFPSTCIDVYGPDFVLAPQSVVASLWTSQTIATASSTYTENGISLTWAFQTAMWADNQQMAEGEVVEMQVKTSEVRAVSSINVSIEDENQEPLGFTAYNYSPLMGTLFDTAGSLFDTAGSVFDSGGSNALAARKISFSAPVVYNRLAVQVTGVSALGFQLGDIYIRARVLGYMQQVP
jgi:hypothetical protein